VHLLFQPHWCGKTDSAWDANLAGQTPQEAPATTQPTLMLSLPSNFATAVVRTSAAMV
jgi:hypothetical protein